MINLLNKEITNFLINLAPVALDSDIKRVGSLHHVINDIERVGDHAKNFVQIAEDIAAEHNFDEAFTGDLQLMYEKVNILFNESISIFQYQDFGRLSKISDMENEIDQMSKLYTNKQIERLQKGESKVDNITYYYYDIISELERIADHCVNVAFSIKSPIGEQYDGGNGLASLVNSSNKKI
jgi:phosphate:Na+ symporter